MRVLAALGALCFAYLAVIPAALVGATVDSACAGSQCGYSPALTVYLVLAFGVTTLGLTASAVAMVMYAVRPSRSNERLVGISLKASAVLVGVLLVSELAVSHPVAAVVITALCVPIGLMGAARRRDPGPTRARLP